MNPLKHPTFFFTAIILLSTSCQKDVNPEIEETDAQELGSALIISPEGRQCTVKKINENNGRYEYLFEYDEKDRVVKRDDYHEGDIELSTTYEYKNNEILVIATEDGTTYDTVFVSHDNKKVRSSVQKEAGKPWQYDAGGNPFVSISTNTYEYNDEGYLTNWETSEERQSTVPETYISWQKSTYHNGNMATIHRYNQEFGYNDYCTIEYYLDKKNVLPVVDDTDIHLVYKANKNLVKTAIWGSTPGGQELSTSTQTYDWNADGLISKMTIKYTEGNHTSTDEFTYEYNYK